MKPGDLVTIRNWNVSHRVPITYVNIYDRIGGDEEPVNVWKWEHGEVGLLMDGRDEDQDRGANDEGYYYAWCDSCCKRTEHDDGCLECG